MKNLLIIAALFLASCMKQNTKPVNAATSDNSVTSGVSFTEQHIDTIHPKKALQVLKSGVFNVTDSCKLFKWQLDVTGFAELTNITLWLNDVQITATSTIENNLITIVPHNLKLPSGVYNYKIRARIVNGNFQTVLSTAIFTDKSGVPLSVSGLPDYGNVFE